MALDQIQAVAAGEAPSPKEPDELSAQASLAEAGAPPAPMAIEQLEATALTAAPTPEPLGALEATAGDVPAPQSLEALGGAATGAGAPEPMSPEELEAASSGTGPEGGQPRARTRKK
jgi:hypothetical protein